MRKYLKEQSSDRKPDLQQLEDVGLGVADARDELWEGCEELVGCQLLVQRSDILTRDISYEMQTEKERVNIEMKINARVSETIYLS